ncbi:sulfotransferase family protein [Coraliomargarita sinensis]|nr:sulfotransferase [Coraliomargarita sinensis]
MEHRKKQVGVEGLNVSYSNWFAKHFLRSTFENQWVIPEPLPRAVASFLRWYEKRCMRIDLTDIPIDKPIFIISLPRCGSSMLQDILCTHPKLAYTTNIMDICRSAPCAADHLRRKFGLNISGERFLKDSVIVDGGTPADPVATWADLFGEDYFEISDRQPDIDHLNTERREAIKTTIRQAIWCHGSAGRRFFCKTPMLLPYLGVLNALFPDAKFIHLIRDPRQGANSMRKVYRISNERLKEIRSRQGRPLPEEPFIPYPRLPRIKEYLERYGADDIRTTASLWNEAIDVVDRYRPDVRHLLEVRYEDILENPAGKMAELFAFCELEAPAKDNLAYQEKLQGIGVVHHKNRYQDFGTITEICREKMLRYSYRPD